MVKITIRYVSIIFLLSFNLQAQQDDQLSQFPFNPLAVNPAYAGCKGGFSGVVSARNQWTGFDGAPKTMVMGLHTSLKDNKMGLGLRLRDEKNVFDQKIEASLCYAYRFKVANGKLGLGISAGITNIKYNWFNVEFKDKVDKFANLQTTSALMPRVDAGLLFNNQKSYISLSGTHLFDFSSKSTDPTYYNSNLSPHLYFIYSRAVKLNDNLTLNPALNAKWAKADNLSIDINLYAKLKEVLWLGVGYRTNNTLIFLAQVMINKKYKIGYSYDYFMNQNTLGRYATHEIILGFDLNIFKSNSMSFRYF